tara:strand:- start:219974 stop:220258 length:285 start_codon:yes stop_codon:yes gene_type:complete
VNILDHTRHIEARQQHQIFIDGGGYSCIATKCIEKAKATGNQTALSTGFNRHVITTPSGVEIEILENGEINISEADGGSVKARATHTINSHYIK